MEENIDAYLTNLYRNNINLIKTNLNDLGFVVKTINLFNGSPHNVISINYKNHIQRWERFARQSRGTILMYYNNAWVPIKFIFDRGAELLTGLHKQFGITSTENITSVNISAFSATQQQTMHNLTINSDIDGYLTTKVDGILVTITCYNGELANIIRETIEQSNDEFGKIILRISHELGCEFVPVISTQRTFNVTSEKAIKYIVTAFLTGLNIATYEQLCLISALEAIEIYGKEIIRRIAILHNNIANSCDSITFSFEAVCANRTCAWNICHDELAITYNQSLIRLLSYSYDLTTVPHFMFSNIISLAGFEEPLWWVTTTSIQINLMLRDLSRTILGEITQEQYFEYYPPANVHITNMLLDPEGFVFWARYGDYLDYNKLKIVEYYTSHTTRNINQLLEIARKTTYFHVANTALIFFNELPNRLISLCYNFRYVFNLPYDNLLIDNNIFNISFDGTLPYEYLRSGLSGGALKSFGNQTLRKKCLMLMNVERSDIIRKLFFEITFPSLISNQNPDLRRCIKDIIYNICPWDEPAIFTNNINKIMHEIPSYINTFYLIMCECDKILNIV